VLSTLVQRTLFILTPITARPVPASRIHAAIMSRVACVWADLADDTTASAEYEDTHISNVVAKLGCTARNAEQAEDNMFKEVAGIDANYMTLYDLPDGPDPKDVVAQIQSETSNRPKNARLDTRVYDEYATWFGDEWPGRKLTPEQTPFSRN